jgi:serine/threonine protein kinase
MHARHIMHRDIKPENILLDEQKRPRISDLGMAKMNTEDGMTQGMGTPAYLAPEILNQTVGVWGYPADVYAFGISCYEIAGGTQWPPPRVRTFAQLRNYILSGQRPNLTHFAGTPGLAALLEKMWNPDPLMRPNFAEVADCLRDRANWLPGVDERAFTEYAEWLERQPASLPPAGLHSCLERVRLAPIVVERVPTDGTILERFAITMGLICNSDSDQQQEIKQFILTQLNTEKALTRIETSEVSGSLIEDIEESAGVVWVQPEGNIYHLRLSRGGENVPIEVTLPADAKVADLHQKLIRILGGSVTIRTVKRDFPADSAQLLTELNLTNLVLNVIIDTP